MTESPDAQPKRPGIPEGADPGQPEHRDYRLYLPLPEGWNARIKQGWEKQYCYTKFPGEEYFHLILNGEIFLEQGDEKLCLTCAMRRGIISFERMSWQKVARTESARLP